MSRIVWDKIGEHLYETGIEKGVLYPIDTATNTYNKGVPWNGLSKVSEKPSGAEASPVYASNSTYLNLMSVEKFAATVEAYTYPPEFEVCDGSAELAPGVSVGQQNRKMFGMCYKTLIGNDTEGTDHGYKLHLVYGALAAPSEKGYQTVNESPEAAALSWELSTTPVPVTGHKPSACLTIDSTKVDAAKLAALEAILYGKDATTEPAVEATIARLPFPDEVKSIMTNA